MNRNIVVKNAGTKKVYALRSISSLHEKKLLIGQLYFGFYFKKINEFNIESSATWNINNVCFESENVLFFSCDIDSVNTGHKTEKIKIDLQKGEKIQNEDEF